MNKNSYLPKKEKIEISFFSKPSFGNIYLLLPLIILLFLYTQSAFSQPNKYKNVVFGCHTSDLDDFEQFVIKAKKAGATHIQLNAEDLPLAYWQMDLPEDPYPAWVITNPGILKTFIPDALKKYIPHETADEVASILEQRCKILRKYNLKAAFHTFEPQMLPEAVFEDHPDWRGPQVDHPGCSRTPRFAPSVDHPEVRKLYIEAMKKFINKCPEVEILNLMTNDSGAGFDWGSLYHGTNGNKNYKNKSMHNRIKDFFEVLQKGAEEAGGSLTVNVYNTRTKNLAVGLDPNMAIDWYEGPLSSRFSANVDDLLYYTKAFSPIVGIPRPLDFLENLERVYNLDAPRLFVSISDQYNKDLYFKIYNEFIQSPTNGVIDNLQFLRRIAASHVGNVNAEKLFELWLALDGAKKTAELLNYGGTIFTIGEVQQRWIVRPLVPFPANLTPKEKDYYREHQFSAHSEEEADNLLIVQGLRIYTGEGGHRYIYQVLARTRGYIQNAISLSKELAECVGQEQKKEYELLTTRLVAFGYLITNVLNVSVYQTELDRIVLARQHSFEEKLSQNFNLTARSKMMDIARNEIDNTSNLIKLLEAQNQISDIIDHAETKDKEYQRLLGPDLIDQLRRKIKIMISHWSDYNNIFSAPDLNGVKFGAEKNILYQKMSIKNTN